MPRGGSGADHNVIEADEMIIHGVGDEDAPLSRAHNTATPPVKEKGFALPSTLASGGGSVGITELTGHGKGGEKEPTSKKTTAKGAEKLEYAVGPGHAK